MLAKLQDHFLDSLFNAETEFLNYIQATETLSAEQSLAIYKGSVYANLMRALGEIYPVTKGLVGAEFFDAMSDTFITQTPPKKDRLDDYGKEFPNFISHFAPAKELPYLADMARLEWNVHQVFHAEEAELSNNLAVLENEIIDPLNLLAYQIPALKTLSLNYEVQALWQMHWQDDWQPKEMLPVATTLVVWRKGIDLHVEAINQEQFKLFEQLQHPIALWQLQEESTLFEMHLIDLLQKQQMVLKLSKENQIQTSLNR